MKHLDHMSYKLEIASCVAIVNTWDFRLAYVTADEILDDQPSDEIPYDEMSRESTSVIPSIASKTT